MSNKGWYQGIYGPQIDQDVDAESDYPNTWITWLNGATIAVSFWSADPGITLYNEGVLDDLTVAWLKGGTVGQIYKIVNRVTASDGRVDDWVFYVRITEQPNVA